MEFLAVDIGNSEITIGCFGGDEVRWRARLATSPGRTSDEYEVLLRGLLMARGIREERFAIGVASVVPQLTEGIVQALRPFAAEGGVFHVGPGVRTGIALRVKEPQALGADRVAQMVGARARCGAPVIVVSLGTAIAVDVLSSQGAYEGGVIAPGVGTALDGLVARAAKLPKIELVWPESLLGKDTVTQMQSGTLLAAAGAIDRLIDEAKGWCGGTVHVPVVLTGGHAGLMEGRLRHAVSIDHNLTLMGIKILAEAAHD